MKSTTIIRWLSYIAGAIILYLLLKPHLNFLYYPFYDAAANGYELKDVSHQFLLNYNKLPLDMFILFTAIAGIRSLLIKPVESSPSRTAVGYFLLGMYEALVAWGISYVVCFCSVAGEQEGCLEFVSKYIPIAAITKGSVISGTILGLVTAFALFISIPIIIIFGIIASATTLIMLPITIVLLGVLVALFYLVKLIYLAITSCDRLILAVCL